MSTKPPVALLITPVLPEPGGSGRALRAWDWLCALAANHDVHVLVAAPVDTSRISADYPAAGVWPLHDQIRPSPRWGRAVGLLCPALGLVSPIFMLDWLHPIGRQLAASAWAKALREESVGRIVVFRMALHPVALSALHAWPKVTAELDLDDLESATRWSVAGSLWRTGQRREALRTALIGLQYRIVERWQRAPYATLWLASADDAKGLRTHLAPRVACRPNRFPARLQLPPRGAHNETRLLFTGSFDYPPNRESARFLLDLTQHLDAARLTWHLTLVGRRPPESLQQQVARQPRVELLDQVEDITSCYRNADVALVPLFSGGGTKLKVLEAMVYGRPVIATEQGVRGLHLEAGRHYLRAETHDEFCDAVVRLARDPELCQRLVRAARTRFDEEFAGVSP